MGETMRENRDDLAGPRPAPRHDEAAAGDRHPGDVDAVGHLDTGRRTAVVQSLQAGPGNAAVQRLLNPASDVEADAATDAAPIQREMEDEEMPDEAAAG